MSKLGSLSHISGWHLLYWAFALYANYQVFKCVFNAVRAVATSGFLNAMIFKLTPTAVIENRKRKHLQG
ncbi:MAG: hypothetical protein JNL11_15890 [Bdellovibrionaceae bacterium]|nr:hypothetical protein [Pseudobdellovibrionaceae bacterium]